MNIKNAEAILVGVVFGICIVVILYLVRGEDAESKIHSCPLKKAECSRPIDN